MGDALDLSKCRYRHTKYQPTETEFSCPKCGAKAGDFCVDDSPDFECEGLHDEDALVCYGEDGKGCPAQYVATGKAFAAMLVKRKNLIPCPHCRGSGYVKRGGK